MTSEMSCESTKPTKLNECLKPIGFMRSVFNKKNGTPRQSSICPQSKGYIELNKDIFNNPLHSILGIQQFSHIWILYYFHMNTNKRCPSKVRPPRLNGHTCGVFASRSPHRPNPIGLSLAKLEAVKESLLYVSGIDILDGTPIVDIKPYIEKYDSPQITISENNQQTNQKVETALGEREQMMDLQQFLQQSLPQQSLPQQSLPQQSLSQQSLVPNGWVDGSVVSDVRVEFTQKSLEQLKRFHKLNETNKCEYCLKHLIGFEDSKNAITSLLRADPRSVYRRTKCVDRLYYFTIDSLHITSWFDIDTNVVEVLKIKPFVIKSN